MKTTIAGITGRLPPQVLVLRSHVQDGPARQISRATTSIRMPPLKSRPDRKALWERSQRPEDGPCARTRNPGAKHREQRQQRRAGFVSLSSLMAGPNLVLLIR